MPTRREGVGAGPSRPVLEARRRAAYLSRSRRITRRRPDQGFAMSSPVAMMSAAAVAMAGLAFLLTGQGPAPERVQLSSAPAPVERAVTLRPRRTAPVVRRDQVYVAVYNNSNITGLAGRTAERISAAGWRVVGSDNWYGTIPATTIYYPPQLKAAAPVLAQDLGVQRVMPAVDPMMTDRLTLILTADFG